MYENIEVLKRELTDKHVVIASDSPELARFAGKTGRVKTVNMNGRALVEFDAWNNTGWYDIDPAYLKVVAEPEPLQEIKPAQPVEKAPPAKSADEPPGSITSTAPRVTHEAGHEAPRTKRPKPQE